MKKQEIRAFGVAFNGKTPSKEEQRISGRPILKIRDIDEAGQFRGVFESFVDPAFYERHAKKKLNAGDTIILNAAHNADYVGSKNAFVPAELHGVIATGEWLVVRVKEVNPKYVNQYLKSPSGRKSLRTCVKGIHLYPKDVERISVPLPPLEDQKRIAHLLGKVEGLIARRKRHLQQLDDLLKSVFLEMFGDPVRNEKGWDTHVISDLCDVKGGKRIPKGESLVQENTGFPYIKAGNIKNGEVTSREMEFVTPEVRKKISRYTVDEGDVCITVVGANIGDVGIVPASLHKASLTENANKLLIKDNKKLNNHYLAHYLMSGYVQQQIASRIRAAGVPKLAIFRIEQMLLLVPPIEHQDKFERIKNLVRRLIARYQQSLTDLENLYGALSQKAFKGELDLSRVPLPTEGSVIAVEEKTDVEEIQPIEPLFELPAPEELAVLQTTEGRKFLLGEWLNAWLEQLGDTLFTSQAFMEAARQRLWELAEDDAPDWGVAEYDELKNWLFKHIEEGKLKQTRKIICANGKLQFGNQVILRARKSRQ
jgi:type I restriction enzyme S subunit